MTVESDDNMDERKLKKSIGIVLMESENNKT